MRWGIIGCGDVTEVKSGPALQKAPRSELVAVMRRNATLAADYAQRHGVPRWYDDAEALLNDPEVDAIYVATPPETHAHYALRAVAAGKPVYVEKPMARNTAECDRMIQAAAGANQKLFVAYYRRCLPRFLALQEVLAAETLGRVTSLRYRFASPEHRDVGGAWRFDAEKAGAGLFLDLAAHVLDLLDFLFGPLGEVAGLAANLASAYVVEDSVALLFRAPGGALGSATFLFASAMRDDTLEITGTRGRVSLSVFGDEPLRLESPTGERTIARPNPPHVQQPLIQAVVDDLLDDAKCPSTGESARRTSRVMDLVLNDYYGGRQDAFWKRPSTWPGQRPRQQ